MREDADPGRRNGLCKNKSRKVHGQFIAQLDWIKTFIR